MDLAFEGSAVDLQSEAYAEEIAAVKMYFGGRHSAARTAFGQGFARWVEFARYAYGEWYRDPERPLPPARDNSLPAVARFRRGMPQDLVSTDVLLEFHYCTTGFLGHESSSRDSDRRQHFRSRAVQPRRLLDFVLKNVLILVRVASVESDWIATDAQVKRNCEDFEIKSQGVIPGVDGGAALGLSRVVAITKSTAQAMQRRLKLHDIYEQHEQLRNLARAELGTSGLADPLTHVADLACVTARELMR